jgi:hypothetical protein
LLLRVVVAVLKAAEVRVVLERGLRYLSLLALSTLLLWVVVGHLVMLLQMELKAAHLYLAQ